MVQAVVDVSTITCSAAISACEKGAKWTRASELFALLMQATVDVDATTCKDAISACENELCDGPCVGNGGHAWVKALGPVRSMSAR